MQKKYFGPIWKALVILILASLACSFTQAATPTAVPTNTPVPPTATVLPTSTSKPTATPNLAATQQAADLQARIQGYVQKGYLTSDKGDFYELQSNTYELAKMNFLDFEDAGYEEKVKNFAVWADTELSSATPVNYPEYSGCGFTFRLTDDGDAYTAMVIKDRVLMTSCRNSSCYEVGKTRGTGKLGYGGDFKASVALIVNETDARVLVDGQFIGQYTLSGDYLTDPGYVAYSLISGTNKDYGTRCDYSNAGLWIPQQ